jgi:hypothetical protein
VIYLLPILGIFYVKDKYLAKNNKGKQCLIEFAQGPYNIEEGLSL